ncbi:hypothetical protein [Pontibacter pamirensis]|nr:hypothetical protein [Pontibacter pamirensis]
MIVLVWSMSQMVEQQEQVNASAQHVEDALIDFYNTHTSTKHTESSRIQ